MQAKNEVTFTVRMLTNQIRRLLDRTSPPDSHITPMQGRVIGFVTHHANQEIYQRDLEREFQIRRSTASAILQSMERNELIRREPVARDARLKRLVLTSRAEAHNDHFIRKIQEIEAVIRQGVPEEEIDAFFRVAARFEENLTHQIATADTEAHREPHGEEQK